MVEARADRILPDELTARAYAAYFDAQMHRGKVRRLIYSSYVHFARASAVIFCLDASDI